jgi:hypothetical protein
MVVAGGTANMVTIASRCHITVYNFFLFLARGVPWSWVVWLVEWPVETVLPNSERRLS